MRELIPEGAPQRVFKAGQFWSSNVSGAALGGAGAVILMSVMMGIVVWMNPDRQNILFAAISTVILVASVLCFLPGNMGGGVSLCRSSRRREGIAPLRSSEETLHPNRGRPRRTKIFSGAGLCRVFETATPSAHKLCDPLVLRRPSGAAC
jgi:hypothetical protein